MTTILDSLPPETCAALVDVEDDTPAWIAVKGERWEAPVGANEPTIVRHQPPADLKALLDARCETCSTYCDERGLEFDHVIDCRDCVDGSALFTIQYRCHANHLIDSHEPLCDDDGFVSVPGRWKLDQLVGPVRPFDVAPLPVEPFFLAWTALGGVSGHGVEGLQDGFSITGRVPVPGDWVAQITKKKP